ncbi:MAG: hypothetical protein MI919_13545 [Holophagales bacterium]|nr:hypothetical protein [Holophagales bacterium]
MKPRSLEPQLPTQSSNGDAGGAPDSPIPDSVLRHFHGYDAETLAELRYRPFLIERLLEQGDSTDLRWLSSWVSEDELRQWLGGGGSRKLSRRQGRFWAWVLDVDCEEPEARAAAAELWPL